MPRRERWVIFADMLRAIADERAALGPRARMTAVAARANVPYDRMQLYLGELSSAGLVTNASPPDITNEGRQFLAEYRKWNDVLDRFGLE